MSTATRMLSWGALLLLIAPAAAQIPAHSNVNYQDVKPVYENGNAEYSDPVPAVHRPFLGFNPVDFEPLVQPFAPAETSGYGNGPRPRVGFFGSYERVYWSFNKPTTAVIGSETATGPAITFPNAAIIYAGLPTILTNSADTGWMQTNPAWGNRIEVGYIDTNDYGWLVSVLDHVSQGQWTQEQNAQMQFDDPARLLNGFNVFQIVPPFNLQPLDSGKIPVRFDWLTMKNVATLNGVEVMRMYRPPRLHEGGVVDVLYGVRYLQMADTFVVDGRNAFLSAQPPTPPIGTTGQSAVFDYFNPLSDASWSTRAQNNLIGPQIGFRWAHQRSRWVWSAEGRFLAAVNAQAVHQKTLLGSNVLPLTTNLFPGGFFIPISFQGLGTNSRAFATTFSPVGEMRLQFAYQLTSNFALKFGYTGIVIGNVTRASNRIDYTGPNLISILPGGNHQLFYSNGINFGVEVNR